MGLLDEIGLGQAMDFGMDIWKQDKAEGMQDHAQNFSASQAAANRDFQERMANTAYQRATTDMQAAGINPMLAYQQGGAHSPAGNAPQGTAASPPRHTPPTASQFSASQAALAAEQKALVTAGIDKTEAEAAEIRARTPTHSASIDRMRQEITESIERVQKIRQDVKTGGASAAHMEQMVRNLQESIPQIRAGTNQLRTLAKLNEAQAIQQLTASGLNEAQAKEIMQRIRADLPKVEMTLRNLEIVAQQMQQPGRMVDEAAKSSFIGQLGAYLRALLPIEGLIGAIPFGRSVKPGAAAPPIHKGSGNRPDIHRR